jgi:hypothetical protein
MSDTPIPQSDIDAWKAKYTAKGVPSTLLEALIAEAELEWEANIGYGQYNRLAKLIVQISDYDTTPNCFYMIVLMQNMNIFNGVTTSQTNWIFANVPCIPLSCYVLKVRSADKIPICEGIANLNHSKDETLTIQLTNFTGTVIQFPTFFGNLTTNLQNNLIGLSESCFVSDSAYQTETTQPIESMVKVNS